MSDLERYDFREEEVFFVAEQEEELVESGDVERSDGETPADATRVKRHSRVPEDFSVPNSDKRNSVFYGDWKEILKQSKALKDERRALLDSRHKYIISCLANALKLREADIEEMFLSDKLNLVEEFFAENGSKKLIFFYQEPNKSNIPARSTQGQMELFITSGALEGLQRIGLLFFRTTDNAITAANVLQEVNFIKLDCSTDPFVSQVDELISGVQIPALNSQENWGEIKEDTVIQDFLKSVKGFAKITSSARQHVQCQFRLHAIKTRCKMDCFQSPRDYPGAAKNHDLVKELERVVQSWAGQIELALREVDQTRKETYGATPSDELEYWKSRLVTFSNFLSEMTNPNVKKVVCILHVAKSRALKMWRTLDLDITNAANEAKDIVKYLGTLQKTFDQLSKCMPSEMLLYIPKLIKSILLIQSVSKSYNNPDHISSLLSKVTNQMISNCEEYVFQGVEKIWDLDSDQLQKKINQCIQVHHEYRQCFQQIRERLPRRGEFEISEHQIFGKMDNFCGLLGKIIDMTHVMQRLPDLQNMKMDGMEKILARSQTIMGNTKGKTYSFLEYRKSEFEKDYSEFKWQVEELYQSLQAMLGGWLEERPTTEGKLDLLAKFENVVGNQVDLKDSYLSVVECYSRDLERIRKLYQNHAVHPPMQHNFPPVSGKILWVRHLFRRIEFPMNILKNKINILKVPEMKKPVSNYNKTASVLIEYELKHHRSWSKLVTDRLNSLNAVLLVKHPQTKKVLVNLSHEIPEAIHEARHMQKMGLEVPDVLDKVCRSGVMRWYNRLAEMVDNIEASKKRIPPILLPLVEPFIGRVDDALVPGLLHLNWTSLNTERFVENVYGALHELDRVAGAATDALECRIERVLRAMSSTCFLELSDDPLPGMGFYKLSVKTMTAAGQVLCKQSRQMERSVYELIEDLKSSMKPTEKVNLEEPFDCLKPDVKHKSRCASCLPCKYYNFIGQLCQRKTEALVKATHLSLETLRKRLPLPKYKASPEFPPPATESPFFTATLHLSIPNIVNQPSLADLQRVVAKVANNMLSLVKAIPPWRSCQLHHVQQQETGEDKLGSKHIVMKTLERHLSDHKEINVLVVKLSTIISRHKEDVQHMQNEFAHFSCLWNKDPEEQMKEFVQSRPTLSDFSAQISFYSNLESQIKDLPATYIVGSVMFHSEPIKVSLVQECRTWKQAFGATLNQHASAAMAEVYCFVDSLKKKLHQPIRSLEDVKEAMAALKEVREAEVHMGNSIGPTEESFAILNRHELFFRDGNAEKVEGLAYAWKNLNIQVKETQDYLQNVQPAMKADLLAGVEAFASSVQVFTNNYDTSGPGVEGLAPKEASHRLQDFQIHFDELWRNYIIYSGGEELFGLQVKEYPDLQRIKRELALLSKLYSLYNSVIDSVGGYYDILWSDVDVEKINGEIQEFQNRIRKLPQALKEWQAFHDLKRTIDDFNETCPLLQMMANKAMLPRHWQRLTEVTGHNFNVSSETCTLRSIMQAPLLRNKEEIEDICVSAVKEQDIEAKLHGVSSEWSSHTFTFAAFKSRGELLLKGSDTAEKVSLIEDSMMILTSLMSNRYNVPFKPTIQQWVHKLSNTTEIIEKWQTVQNLWIYLEAVFVGGDIAKQLPQEAKRFQQIDKSWQKIMQQAHEIPNIVQCCVGDDTLAQLLPHLLEQLEVCQKSLTGYLEKKRLVFPRFFFVSDPVLLEILGQASDSHTIQTHLLSLFDNVHRVTFSDISYDQICSIQSQEGETVDLIEPVMAQGNVEVWLGQLLEGVKKTIHSIIQQAHVSISEPEFSLVEFQTRFPAQVGLLGIQMIWTRDSEQAISVTRTDKKIMQKTNQKFLDILNELIDMTTCDLSTIERTKYETLITIHVHQKDIFDDLVRKNIHSTVDFEWQKQSRFYFLEEKDRCVIQITDVEFNYCNEYLGCTDRLVITPLTDRCYITLAQALGMNMGGAPAGPAGTGKTETTKDMGRCLGKYVVVFNCSDQMDYRGLGRIYKGLAQSGSWGCFDEFNRIELPVLSVAAQQIYTVLQCKKNKEPTFVFMDGDVVDMDREFGIFLTMNPGYAGRQELPENLKIQFRIVAMMVPDRAIIMRVKLASAGFRDNQILSRKFYTLYKLCEEQLSKQVHYDFGLRNILSVLRTLGAVKRSNPAEQEKTVVMRVLRDMNLSKLVDEDEPLFMSLINDLFPGITLDKAGYPELEAAIQKQAEESGLIAHQPWVLKLVQLYETQRVRHGMMTLGPSGAGKTTCIHTLMKAMTDCGEPHREMRMNPKAISASQMFGTLDVATNDWTDGIFSTLWRKTLKAKKGEHVWIVLDGPVDAIWIENLNSVLDDNKTLTLANGDRIPMAPNCKIVFEPHNIDNASPATVSRNGMVFMSSSVLDWQPILQAWLRTLPPARADTLWGCFSSLFQDLINFVYTAVTPKMHVLECMYIKQAIDLLQGLLPPAERETAQQHIGRLFVFAMMWSLGALLELEDRVRMENFLRTHNAPLELPQTQGEATVFEFLVNDRGQWEHWSNKVPEYIYPKDSVPSYTSILVPNVDSVRTDFLMHTVMKQGKAVLLIGEQGTAKTVMVKGYTSKYDPEAHLTKSLNFSSATLPNMFQRSIESYIDKRVGSTYGPPAGKRMTVFIDDINMPVINEWGDQITNEIVRQLMEQGGFYNLDRPGEFTAVVDAQFVAAMIHPGGGRNDIPQRLKRQFDVFNCTLPSNNSIDKIFRTVANGYFCSERGFPDDVCSLARALVATTRKLWQVVKVKMLPTPAKFHYVFNLRDLSRIWQGILKVCSDVCVSPQLLLALFFHECTRVIADRFTDQTDKEWFEQMMTRLATEDHGAALIQQSSKEDYFVDFLRDAPEATGDEPEDAELQAPKTYEPILSFEALSSRLTQFMQQYNEAVRGAPMDLVFFRDAMIHLVKISRIICTPQGNALLVGVGGSGKQSLTRLASFIAGYQSFQITLTRTYNVNNLMDDLKFLYRTAGQKGKGITFIFTDNDIKDEAFLEYMNNVLASGEVSNLFSRDELDEITQDLIPVMKREHPRRQPTPENLYDYFLSRVRSNLHVVLCFSPVGEKFRTRALKFPGLISGCTIDWFQRWPRDALEAVAQHFLTQYNIKCSQDVKQSVVATMGAFQDMVAEKCVEYFDRFRRQTYVTPKSYLSFIEGYKTIYSEKVGHVGMLAERMSTGLSKLMEAEVSVNQLAVELEIKEKDLAIASKKADEVLQEVAVKAEATAKVKMQSAKANEKAAALVREIDADKAEAESKLQEAEPALAAAEAALQTIKPSDIATVKKLGKPPHLIMRIMDCVLVILRRKIDPLTMDPERPCPRPSWGEAQKLMNFPTFLSMLLNFNKDAITEETVELLQPYMEMDDYNLETAKRTCGNVAGLCSWTEAMVEFFAVNKQVLPLKANLAVQQGRLDVALAAKAEAQEELDKASREEDAANTLYKEALDNKRAYEDDAQACRRKMANATALIQGLGGEKVRWTESSTLFQLQIKQLVGDVLMATGFLSYAGPFNQEFRNLLLQQWRLEMSTRKIPFSYDLNVISMLVDNATIGEWNLQGLPSDDLSIQNGIIVTKASRYPLLIDPQGQGKAWIKNREKDKELQVTTLNHKYFRTHLEDCLSLGRPLLIEDVGEDLDPALDNILEKNYIKIGSTYKVKVGDKEVDVMAGFTLYITTKLANPVYTPEISAKTAVIDFTVTIKGLEDQLLGRVILLEKQELEAERVKLLEEVTTNKRKMQELEDNLLYRLTSTQGSLVEDDSLIEVLKVTKTTAEEVREKLAVAADTEVKINMAREEYRPVATRGSILYFLIVEMSLVNIMYQTSLRQFLGLFDASMENSEKSPITPKRIASVIEFLTYEVFRYTAQGLYENHKFLFTLLLALKIDLQVKNISHREFQTFIKGGASLDLNSVDPKPKKWIQDMTWLNLVQLSQLYPFTELLSQVAHNDQAWKSWFDKEAPEEALLPNGYDNVLDTFRKLLLIRCWCPDRTIAQARHYIAQSLGKKYAEGIILDMDALWSESDKRTPLVCLLSMGSDPTENIERLSKTKHMQCQAISMGQGQEVHARRLLVHSMTEGGWLLLQNCHLGLNFMDELLDAVTMTENVHNNFRVWVTTEMHPKFPINLLQSSIKFTNEPPQGVKAGLKRTYGGLTQDQLDLSNFPQWRPLLYGVAFLHSTVQERRKFGPLGWNIPYEFSQADFTSSLQFVQKHLDDMDAKQGVNWSCLRYMLGEVLYGGRVTDDLDKRLLNTFAGVWFGEDMFGEQFCFYTNYVIPKGRTLQDVLLYIDTLPLVDSPEVFGLHANADITYQTTMANETLHTIVNIQPKDGGSGGSETREAAVQKLADEMLEKLPADYVPHEVKAHLKKMGTLQPMNIFLRQEVDRMQRIIGRVRGTLNDLKLAIDGTIIMSEDLRDALDNMYNARIPKLWYKISWESATLGFWFTELLERNQQFHSWLFNGRPNQFWLTGFFNPQGFLTAMRQETTRMNLSKGWALDTVILHNEVTKMMKEEVTAPPPTHVGGVYIHGLFLDGAGWDRRNSRLAESPPKVLFTPLPVVHVYAISTSSAESKQQQATQLYLCPVYKKPRRTDLTYIFSLLLRSAQSPEHWTLRGVALLCDCK